MHSHGVALDPHLRCADAIEFENDLRERFIGQKEAAATAVRMLQTYMAGLNNPDQPAGIMLALGPTGTGKTRSRPPASRKKPTRARARAGQPPKRTPSSVPSSSGLHPLCRHPLCLHPPASIVCAWSSALDRLSSSTVPSFPGASSSTLFVVVDSSSAITGAHSLCLTCISVAVLEGQDSDSGFVGQDS